MIIGGSSSQKLAAKVAKELNDQLCPIETRKFPDGERYIRIKGEIEKEVVVIQSTGFPQDENIMELLFILKNLKSLGAEKIKVVIPYFGYGRQEKRFKRGESVSAAAVASLIEDCGASELICINLHEKQMCDFFNIPVHELSAIPLIARHIQEQLENPVIIAPDKGALLHAQEISRILDCPCDHMEKTRLSPDKVETRVKNLDVKGLQAVIIDDIISTGGTIVNATEILMQHGAESVTVGCVHPVLVEDALLKIFATGVEDVLATDTLTSQVSSISVAPLIAEALK
ncbi:ribose-phosphate diphosphokinase [Methanobacterium alkalithermotolerans]|uniref:Ribose-phosphate pyrophosphokinase n=1 Tax=Methanobacterium alkalithermotolerans TaxID=2731220 RepID=A0A8T8K4E3_9EURY|nr:ribose-phosphate diphosphokinase [Methanobacterium alkalithermotolerans]QUH22857.1 ribose-phosphate diphosphokinase [Methanobacterium alkalithermotolerans]RJS48111.1 MAG: ribose-phosphate diphosphokinase [Methanobacterium sp.]